MKYILALLFLAGCDRKLVCIDGDVYLQHDGVTTKYGIYDGVKCVPDKKGAGE